MAVDPRPARPALRWTQAGEEALVALFPDETALERHVGTGAYRGLEFLHVNARSIINTVPASTAMPFRHTINAYRGCSHACAYCFARPTHDYLGLGIGEDFDTKIVVKVNAVERLGAEIRSSKWGGEHIAMGTNTDPYQAAEGKYHLTRGIIGVLSEARNPFSILTKSTLVLRDLEALAVAAGRTAVHLNLSIGTLDRDVWRLTEPGTPPPDKRVDAVRRLNEAGIPVRRPGGPGPAGLSDGDDQVRQVVEACRDAGAISISAVALHLRPGIRDALHGLAGPQAARPGPPLRRALRRPLLPGQVRAGPAGRPRGRVTRRSGAPAVNRRSARGARFTTTGHPDTTPGGADDAKAGARGRRRPADPAAAHRRPAEQLRLL